mmetsp:Transcript_26422/g.55946  ORF Transcript_26422/g.55946 Transcript_26422/m.55946 type:complete len:89 (-) Transcript_26422:201-467(-)
MCANLHARPSFGVFSSDWSGPLLSSASSADKKGRQNSPPSSALPQSYSCTDATHFKKERPEGNAKGDGHGRRTEKSVQSQKLVGTNSS